MADENTKVHERLGTYFSYPIYVELPLKVATDKKTIKILHNAFKEMAEPCKQCAKRDQQLT